MKKIEYLSPTSLRMYTESKQEFYLNYLSDNRPPKFPQTGPMSVGSSFDAYAKSFLHEHLFGKGNDPRFDLTAIFEAQVESHNRDQAWECGKHCFEEYKASGALSDLMVELGKAIGRPRFEIEVRGVVNGQREGVTKSMQGVTFLGKPDVFFINSQGAHVIFDWKVNGFYAARATSPMQGYVRLREPFKDFFQRKMWSNKGQHKGAQLLMHNGVMINAAGHLEDFDEDWARQLSIYGWLCGEDIGSDFIVAVDQLVCKPVGAGRPEIRIAEHRTRVRRDYQWRLFALTQEAWEVVHSDHIFREVSKEESQARCTMLDGIKKALEGDGTPEDKWFADITRG